MDIHIGNPCEQFFIRPLGKLTKSLQFSLRLKNSENTSRNTSWLNCYTKSVNLIVSHWLIFTRGRRNFLRYFSAWWASAKLLFTRLCHLVKQVRTQPQASGRGGEMCIWVFRPGGRLSWYGAAGEDKVCGAHSRSVKCITLLSSSGPR